MPENQPHENTATGDDPGKSTTTAKQSARSLLAAPIRRHVLAAEGTSKLGDWFTFVAASVIVYDLGGGKALGAFHVVRGLVPVLLGPRAGNLSSRFHPVRLMIATDLVRALLIASVGFLAAFDLLTWPAALVLFSVAAGLGAIFRPAQMIVLSKETPDELKPAINGFLTLVQTGALSVGPILAGLATVWLGPTGLMLVDAATYTLSALLLVGALSFQALERSAAEEGGKPSFRNVATLLLAVPRFRAPYVFHLTSHVVAGSTFVIVVGIAQRFADPESQIGYLTGVIGVGSVIGALVATRIAARSTRKVMAGATLLLGPLLMVATNFSTWILIAVAMFVLGVTANLVEPFAWSEYQQSVPEKLMGASFGFIDATTTASILGASAVVGWLLDLTDVDSIGLVVGAVVMAASLGGLLLFSPQLATRSNGK